MTNHSKRLFLIILFTILISANGRANPVLASDDDSPSQPQTSLESIRQKKNPYADLPPVEGVMLTQIGADTLRVVVSGKSLERPELNGIGSDLITFTIRNAYLPSGTWERDFSMPLADLASAAQTESSVVFRIRINKPLILKELSGNAPGNRFVLRFETADTEARQKAQQDLVPKPAPVSRAGDPFAKKVPVTMDLRDVELRDVFRMLGAYAKMNIVADPSVPNTLVTMTLNSVPLDEAMGYLMRMYGMTYAIMGKTVIVGTPDSIGKTTGKESVRSYRIAYADMKQVGGLVQSLSGVGKVVVDERLRTIYVTGRPEQFYEVEKVLQAVDHPGRQVMLQARIMEVTDNGKEELETIVDAIYNQWWFNYSSAGAGAGYVYANDPNAYDPVTGDNRPAPLAPMTGDGLVNIAGNALTKMLDVGIRSLVTANKGKLLADPSVITVDGETAIIKLVENYPYISERDEAGNPQWDEEEVGPKMEFTPQIGRDGMVTMRLKISTGEIIGTYRGQAGEQFPQTTNREVDTKIRVRNGEPFVVGGLYKDQKKSEKHRVPLLSDIPLLGNLFKYKSESRDKTEVAMIVIPYILDIPDATVERAILK